MRKREMKDLVNDYDGQRNFAFSQSKGLRANWRELLPASQGGVCGGLSLIWLHGQKFRKTRELFGQNTRYLTDLFKVAEHAQQLGSDNLGPKDLNTVAASFSLNSAGAEVYANTRNIAPWIKRIVTGASPLVFIAVYGDPSGHAVAANVRKPQVRLFEPNYGMYTFPSTLKFVGFFSDYLGAEDYKPSFLKFYK